MKTLAWLPLAAVLALGACGDDDSHAPLLSDLYAHTRVVNASPAAAHANAQMYADEERIGTVFQFGTASACNTLTVAEGMRTISFRTANGAAIAEADHEFVSGTEYIIALVPDPASAGAARVSIFTETFPASVATGMNALRVINATSAAGDVVFTTPTGTVTTTTPARIALAAGASTTSPVFGEVATASTRARLYNTGTATGPVGDHTLTSTGTDRTSTLVFTTPTVARPLTGIQLNRCVH